MTSPYVDINELIDEIRVYRHYGREIVHLTIVYHKIDNFNPEVANRVFSKWYLSRYLPFVLDTRYYTKKKVSCYQPYTRAFLDCHFNNQKTAFIHHHAIVCLYPETMKKLEPLLNLRLTNNDIHQLTDFKQVQSVLMTKRDEWIATYSAKSYQRYKNYELTFGG